MTYPSPTDAPCRKSILMDLMLSFHQRQQDRMVNPLQIQLAWTSSADMAPSQLPWSPLVSLQQLSCSLQLINESHLWGKKKNIYIYIYIHTQPTNIMINLLHHSLLAKSWLKTSWLTWCVSREECECNWFKFNIKMTTLKNSRLQICHLITWVPKTRYDKLSQT